MKNPSSHVYFQNQAANKAEELKQLIEKERDHELPKSD